MSGLVCVSNLAGLNKTEWTSEWCMEQRNGEAFKYAGFIVIIMYVFVLLA